MWKIYPNSAIPISSTDILQSVSSLFNNALLKKGYFNSFEKDLTSCLRAQKIITTNLGRSSLYLALNCLGLNKGDEVLVPAYTCAIVFNTILHSGLKPVFVDVNPLTFNLDANLIINSITPKTRVILPVHLFGRPCEMDVIQEIAHNNDLYIVEDVAQAIGAKYKKRNVGSWGDLAIYSFGPGKSITSGEGGAIAINNDELIDKLEQIVYDIAIPSPSWSFHVFKNILAMKIFSNPNLYPLIQGFVLKNIVDSDENILRQCMQLMKNNDFCGKNLNITRMGNFSSIFGNLQLIKMKQFNTSRMFNAQYLSTLFGNYHKKRFKIPSFNEEIINVFLRYPIKFIKPIRNKIIKELIHFGVDVNRGHASIKPFLLTYSKAKKAIELCDSLLTIPCHPLLNTNDLKYIAETLLYVSKKQ